ncbi:MAG: matrixin family metalloprotease [Alphaproteobacteria bacterium]|nr:matrixin family metalloprotease [Alphaproteobacteria bacterium]
MSHASTRRSARLLRGVARTGLVAVAAMAVSTPALAWKHLGHVWLYEDMPIPFKMAGVESYGGFNTAELEALQERAWQSWRDGAPCAEMRAELVEVLPPESNIGYTKDGVNLVSFDDVANDLTESGTLAAALTWPNRNEDGRLIGGEMYWRAIEGDIIFNNDVSFTTDAEIAANNCRGGNSIDAVAAHEYGHIFGLGHSCEREDVCNDSSLRNALMYWQADNCEATDVAPDDVQSLNALYGPYASFECSHEIDPTDDSTQAFGVVPFTLKCAVVSDNTDQINNATWNWGDGTITHDVEGTHEYTEPGNYTVNVCFDGQSPSCGEWEYCFRRSGYVRACGVPEPSFTYEPVEGLSYRLLNETDIGVYGCIFDIQWDVFAGDSATGEPIDSVKSWEPVFAFPEAGTYTVVLNIGGPAGTGAAKLTFDVRNAGRAGGCDQSGGGAAGLLALAGLALVARRRRRA